MACIETTTRVSAVQTSCPACSPIIGWFVLVCSSRRQRGLDRVESNSCRCDCVRRQVDPRHSKISRIFGQSIDLNLYKFRFHFCFSFGFYFRRRRVFVWRRLGNPMSFRRSSRDTVVTSLPIEWVITRKLPNSSVLW